MELGWEKKQTSSRTSEGDKCSCCFGPKSSVPGQNDAVRLEGRIGFRTWVEPAGLCTMLLISAQVMETAVGP